MKEELEQAQKETQHCQERLRCVMFQHIPQVSPRFKDMGPIDQLIKEEIVTKEEELKISRSSKRRSINTSDCGGKIERGSAGGGPLFCLVGALNPAG